MDIIVTRWLIASSFVFLCTNNASAQNAQVAMFDQHGKCSTSRAGSRESGIDPPLAGAEISFLFVGGGIYKTVTDAEGKYRIKLPLGRYKTVCNLKDYESDSTLDWPMWSNKTNQDQTLNFALVPKQGAIPVDPVSNPQTMMLTGYGVYVTAGSPAQPVNNATVTFFNANGQSKEVKAYPNHNMHFISLPPARYRVVVTANGFQPYSQMLAPTNREGPTRVNVLLK